MADMMITKLHSIDGDMWKAELDDRIAIEYNQDEAVSRCVNGGGAGNPPLTVSGPVVLDEKGWHYDNQITLQHRA